MSKSKQKAQPVTIGDFNRFGCIEEDGTVDCVFAMGMALERAQAILDLVMYHMGPGEDTRNVQGLRHNTLDAAVMAVDCEIADALALRNRLGEAQS